MSDQEKREGPKEPESLCAFLSMTDDEKLAVLKKAKAKKSKEKNP